MRNIYSVCFLLVHCSFLLNASVSYEISNPDPLFEPWRWKTFSILSDKGVRCFTEGIDRQVWFGTAKGVFHYDGLEWKQYLEENEVLNAPVYALCYTSSDNLYAATTKGICHYTKGKWETDVLFPAKDVLGSEWEVLHMIGTKNGEIWVGLHFGLIRIVNNKVTLFSSGTQIADIKASVKNVDIQDISNSFSDIEPFVVFSLMEDSEGILWLGLEDGRILRLNKSHDLMSPGNYTLFAENKGLVISRQPILYETKSGIIYSVTQTITGAVNQFDRNSELWTSHQLSTDFGGDDLNFSICETPDGVLWIGGLNRIFAFRNDKWSVYKQPELQVPASRIILKPATDGSLWIIGHQADVIRIEYKTTLWTTYNDLLFQCSTSDGREWFLNAAGKVVIYNPSNLDWEMLGDEFPLNDPVRIYLDNSEVLWAIGSQNGEAALAWSSGGDWIMKTFADLCWSFHPNGVFQSRDNSVWFGASADCGSASWGIVRYSPEKGNRFADNAWQVYKGTQVCEVAYALGETEKNTLLCGNYKGLFEYSGSTVRDLHQVLAGDVLKIESMVQDPEKGVWIGTRGQGIIKYTSDNEWKQYTLEDGLASNTISSLIFTDDSTLWAATEKGISRFDGNKWNQFALPDYFKILRGNGSLERGSFNSIWINNASIEWYRRVFFKKSYDSNASPLVCYKVQPELSPPETKIVKFDKKVYYPGNAIIVWKGTDRWNDTKESEIQYSYRIDDEAWSDFSLEANHTFLSMHRGRHKIQVRARDNFLNIDALPAEAEFRVIPPVWGQVWFLLLITGFIAAIVYLFTLSLKKNKAMEEQRDVMKKKNEDLVKQQSEIEEKGNKIMVLLEKERESHWFNEGVIAINDVIKSNKENLDKLAHALIVKLIEYLEVHSAGILLLRNGENGESSSFLELLSAYGYNKQRLANKRIMPEEGLAGACFKEKKTMIFRNVPPTYFIESGMGKANIAELVLVPLKHQDEIVGIIEISSLKPIEDRQVRLLEIVSENVASNIMSLEAKARIEELYKQAQENAVRLHEQEEELHQQMEELQATQEESQRRERELLAALEEYRKKKSPSAKKE